MNNKRLPALVTVAGLAALLSGCVVAPVAPRPVAVYPAPPPAYVEPAPVVVVPAPGYYRWGYRHWR